MAANRVALILGAGPRIGASVADRFAKDGYDIVLVSRKGTGSKNADGFLTLKADFSKPDEIAGLFEAVKKEFQSAPSVVIYNAAMLTPPPDPASVLSVPAENVISDFNVNTISPYVAAQQALSGWETLPKAMPKTFIYTGNVMNSAIIPVPMFLTAGMGKSATAHWIGLADALYTAQGYRFHYADEHFPDGKFKGGSLDGPAHADFYAQLAKHEGNVPWCATFVKDDGYVKF